MEISVSGRVRDIFSKYDPLSLVNGEKPEEIYDSLVQIITAEVEGGVVMGRGFADFQERVRKHFWPYLDGTCYKEVIKEMSRDLHI